MLNNMGFLTKILKGESRSQDGNWWTQAVSRFLSGEDDVIPKRSSAGIFVTEQMALSLTAVYACVSLRAETIASLPLHTYEQVKGGNKEKVFDHKIRDLTHTTPNPMQTSYKWRELMLVHHDLWGAGISEIEFNRDGNPVALWPIPPWLVEPKLSSAKEVVYEIKLPNGKTRTLAAYQTLVISALSTSAFKWQSPIAVHRETLSAAMAVKDFGARTFGQGTNPAGVVTKPATGLTEDAEKSLRKDLGNYAGLSHSHRVMLLEAGMEFKRIGLPPEDAQYLETRRFDISEIARIFKVPLFLLQDHEKQTSWGKGLEEQKSGFVTFTLTPILVKWEQEIKRRLFLSDEDKNLFVEFVLEGLLRGSLKDRYEAYVKGINNGFLSPNDVRALENMNSIENGDKYFVAMNLQSLESVDKLPPPDKTKTGDKKQ